MDKVVPLVLTLAASILYSTIRYIGFAGEHWANWPSYILNKSLCLALALFLFSWVVQMRRGNDNAAGLWARAAFHCMVIHVLLSMALLTPAYFDKFYDGPKMNRNGELMLLFGALAVYSLGFLRDALPRERRRLATIGGLSLVILHVVFIGYPSWIAPWTWPGYMPPISFLSAMLVLASLLLYLAAPPRPVSRQET